MRDLIFIVATMVLTWLAVYIAIEYMEYPVVRWALITSASISAIFAGLMVLLGETIIEDIVKVVFLMVPTTILSLTTPKLEYAYICALIAAVLGLVMNQINQFIADKATIE